MVNYTNTKEKSLALVSGALAALSAIHWVVPFAIGGALISILATAIFPEIAISLFLFGSPLIKGIITTTGTIRSYAVIYAFAIAALLGIFAKQRGLRLPRIDAFSCCIFAFVAWAGMSLMWTFDFDHGLFRFSVWLLTGIVPMILIRIMIRSGVSLKGTAEIAMIIGIPLLIISFITMGSTKINFFERFGIAGEDWNYARSIGLLLLISIWMVDKVGAIKKIFAIAISIISLYFLIIAATRAPFAVAAIIAVIYLLFFSRTKISTRIFVFASLVVVAVLFLAGSYMVMRWISIGKAVEMSSSLRILIWRSVFAHADKIPFYGLGIGGVRTLMPQFLRFFYHAHNNFLDVLVELGIGAFLIYFSIMIVFPMRTFWKFIRNRSILPVRISHGMEFAFLVWAYGIGNDLVNDAFNTARLEWIALGMVYEMSRLMNAHLENHIETKQSDLMPQVVQMK